MKKIYFFLLLFIGVLSTSNSFGQRSFLMKNGKDSTGTCGGLFLDSGGAGTAPANQYRNNETYTYTFCSDDTAKTHMAIGFDLLDLAVGDELCFFDGRSVTDSLLGCASDFARTQNSIIETTSRNPSGCLTVTFRSNNDGIVGNGWLAHMLCIASCQTVKAQITATTPPVFPADTGWIDACPNGRISFKGRGVYSLNDIAYHQADSISNFEWNFGDGSPIARGPEVDHIFTQAGGYNVRLVITDQKGCKNINYIKQRVRISPRPTFNTGSLVSQVCSGTEIKLRGQSQQLDSSYQVSTQPNTGTFPSGQVRSEILFIPDDSSRVYKTSVYFTDFGPGQTLTNITDLTRIFATMEHSWGRDIKIDIVCPSLQSVALHKYDVATRGDNILVLGVPATVNCTATDACIRDPLQNPPGTGYEYSWVPAALPTFRTKFPADRARHTLPAGNYGSDAPLTGLLGCPLNGEWSLVIKDQWKIDNGWIFQWGIEFKKSLYPAIETFRRTITDHYWRPNTNITNYMRDSIVSRPQNAGVASFSYEVVDNAGCVFDTTVNVNVLPPTNVACRTCTPNFNDIKDTSVCAAEAGVLLNKTAIRPVNNSITFEAFPNKVIDAVIAPLAKPDTSKIIVRDLFQTTLTSPLTQIDSVCFDMGTKVGDDIFVQLLAPNNTKIPLMNTRRGGFALPLRNVCFSPLATRPISTATPPITGLYQAENGAASWNVFNGSPINGTWKLLVADSRGAETDTINQWSITFKSGNAYTYNWTTPTGLSCFNCPTPVAKPAITTQYVVTVVDSMACVHKDTVNVTIRDSLAAPPLTVSASTFNSVQFSWTAVAGATSYQVSINGGPWIVPNGTLNHRVTGLTVNQDVSISVRALGGTCGSRVSNLSARALDCIATIGRGANRRLEVDSVLCYGLASPLVNFRYASGDAGTVGFTYIIDTFRQNSSGVFVDKIKAGQHRAIFIDGTGCADTLDFHFGQPDSISFRVTADSVKCNGGRTGKLTSIASGGKGQLTYSLNLSASRRNIGTFDTLAAGRYTIEVQDSNRCRKSITADVFQPTPLSMSLSKTDVRCFGNTTGTVRAIASGGTAGYTYAWRSGQTRDTINNVGVGAYFLTLTDQNGCTKQDSTTISSNPKIVIATFQDSVKCFGEASGRARARSTGGLSPFFYSWGNGQLDSTAANVRAGLHRLTVTDALGCSDTSSITVLQPDSLRFDTLASVPASCSNTASGSMRVVVSGGTRNYVYAWSPNGATTPSVSGVAAGNYSLTVRDFNNCSKTQPLVVSAAPPLVLDYFDEIKVKCQGDATGGLSAKVSGGAGGYGFRWNTTPVQTSDTAKNLRTGSYRVTITDRSNCQIIKDTTIGEPTKLVANITQYTNVKCRGEANGTATPSVFGGTGIFGNNRYLFQWNDPLNQNSLIADSLAARNYIVTVTDANGCTDTANVTITEPPTAVTSTTTQTRLACFGQNTGEGRVLASGGSGNYTYRWSNLQSTATATNLTRAKYFVTVTDINGCRNIDSLEAFTLDSITADIALVQPTCYNTSTGNLTLTRVSGGSGNGNLSNYFFRWSTNPVQTTAQAANVLGNRQYAVTITDNQNCSNVAYAYLNQPSQISLSSVIKPVSCFGGNDGEAQINAFGTNNAFSFTWSDSRTQRTQRATQLTAGRYTVLVRDSAGCTKDTLINIGQPPRLKMDAKTIVDNKCVGDSTATIDVTFSGGTPTYNYLWSNGGNKPNLTKLRSGTYILTISDANGCKMNDTIVVKSPEAIDADLTTIPVRCFGDRNGVITINAFGGTTPYLYSLDGKTYNGISQIVGLKSAAFDIFVKDANGCIWFTKENVGTPPKFTVEATADATINLGDKIQLFANPQNAQGKVTLTWKQPYDSTLTCLKCPNPTASPQTTIIYTVQAVDSVGCRAADSVKITVEKPRNIYVPTGFTPNNDRVNDKLIVHGRNGTFIDLFRVYDRWGELVYEARTFKINDENAGWNGTFKGQELMTGKFVWYIEATYIDGAKEILKGHTTLIR